MHTMVSEPEGELPPGALDFNPDELESKPPARIRDRKREWQRRRGKVYDAACEIRTRMRRELGDACHNCGATLMDFDTKGKPVVLCFDHGEYVRDWDPSRMNLLQRMRMYERDHKMKRIKLSCNECNGFDGANHGKERARRHRKAMERR
jgi:hypothetical protein